MANYTTLKAAIQAAIYENGNNEITGAVLQQSLLSMITSLGDGYQFMGIATPSTNPGTPDERVFYLAYQSGDYTNFGFTLQGQIVVFLWDTAWVCQTVANVVINNNSNNALSISVVGNDVELSINDAELTLDSVAYEGMTYREIFETHNVISFPAGFEDGLGTYTISAGNPAITTEEADSGTHSLKCSGTTSQQIVSPATATGKAWFASRVKITSWTAGYCGVQYGVGGSTNHDGGVSGVTDGWVTKVARKDNSTAYRIYIGSFLSANLTGYVDTPVVIFDNIFTDVPSEQVFTALYNTYCALKRGESTTGTRTLKLLTEEEKPIYSASECKSAFVAAMNAKAKYIGATTVNFVDASGLSYSGSAATVKDILQIMVHASGIAQIAEKWNKDTYSMTVYGGNARTEVIETSVQNSNFDESEYPILGGKTGTITASGNVNYNVALIVSIAGEEYVIIVMGDSTDTRRWADAQAIADYLAGVSSSVSVNAPCAGACKLPQNPIMYDNFTFNMAFSKAITTTRIPASLTKIMSLILAYDYIDDENEIVTIESSDIIGGSGDNIQSGDKLTIRDLVYDMLLPSSNDAATALARHIGYKILTLGN